MNMVKCDNQVFVKDCKIKLSAKAHASSLCNKDKKIKSRQQLFCANISAFLWAQYELVGVERKETVTDRRSETVVQSPD